MYENMNYWWWLPLTGTCVCVNNECQVVEMFNLHLNFFIAEIACPQSFFLTMILVASARGKKEISDNIFGQKSF